jgi:hypothetical protein
MQPCSASYWQVSLLAEIVCLLLLAELTNHQHDCGWLAAAAAVSVVLYIMTSQQTLTMSSVTTAAGALTCHWAISTGVATAT